MKDAAVYLVVGPDGRRYTGSGRSLRCRAADPNHPYQQIAGSSVGVLFELCDLHQELRCELQDLEAGVNALSYVLRLAEGLILNRRPDLC